MRKFVTMIMALSLVGVLALNSTAHARRGGERPPRCDGTGDDTRRCR